jgi:glyoxylase-like metal-dependent hydrolase (beta-lactamase superfamily II)
VKKIADDIYQWSVFSEEKQLDFNGLWIRTPEMCVLIDPPPFDKDVETQIRELGKPARVFLTNKDHRRAAPKAGRKFGAWVCVHERDAPHMDCDFDRTFPDGELLAGVLEVIPVSDSKSPGECALYWRERKLLIVGDALIGKPPGSLSMLPDAKFADPAAARVGAARLAELEVDMLLVGDGVCIAENGGAALAAFAG